MRILITGASGSVGSGVTPLLREAGHAVVWHDLKWLPPAVPFFQGDLRFGENLDAAADGCDCIIHTAAWHGVHGWNHTENDFWRTNIDGTWNVLQAAVRQKVSKVVFLSSVSRYNHYDKYGFTKVMGEEICEYHWRNHQIRYAALRPGNFTPWRSFVEYGSRFLTADPDRRDVLACVKLAAESDGYTNDWFHVLSTNPFTEEELARWDSDAASIIDARVPGGSSLCAKYGIDLKALPRTGDIDRTRDVLGFVPNHNFLTFLHELRTLDAEGTIAQTACDYPPIA